jgi:hypothetical protein
VDENIVLETPRLLLRKFTLDDIASLEAVIVFWKDYNHCIYAREEA